MVIPDMYAGMERNNQKVRGAESTCDGRIEGRNGEAQAAMHSVLDVSQGEASQLRRGSWRFGVGDEHLSSNWHIARYPRALGVPPQSGVSWEKQYQFMYFRTKRPSVVGSLLGQHVSEFRPSLVALNR